MKSSKIEDRPWKSLRKQFDVVGLTVEAGWSDDKIRAFVKTPNWFSKYSWNKEQKREWVTYITELYRKDKSKSALDVAKDVVNWEDLDHGWKDI